MPDADALKESSLGFERIDDVHNAFKKFLHQCAISEEDLAKENVIRIAQELVVSKKESDEFLAKEYMNWIIAVRPQDETVAIARQCQQWLHEVVQNKEQTAEDDKKGKMAASILQLIAEQHNPIPLAESIGDIVQTGNISCCDTLIDVGLTDNVVEQVKSMMASENLSTRYEGAKLCYKVLRADHGKCDDKQLRVTALGIIKAKLADRFANDVALKTSLQRYFDELYKLDLEMEFIQLMNEFLTSSEPTDVMVGLWLALELYKKGVLKGQDLKDLKNIDAACSIIKLPSLWDRWGFVITDLTDELIKNGFFEPAHTIASQLLNVYKNDSVEEIFHKARPYDFIDCQSNVFCMNAIFERGVALFQKLIEKGHTSGQELVAIIDEQLTNKIFGIVMVAIEAAAQLLQDGIYPLSQVARLKERGIETKSFDALHKLANALIKIKKFDQAYEIANSVPMWLATIPAEIFTQLIENNYFPPLDHINRIINKLGRSYRGQEKLIADLCSALIRTKKSEYIEAVQKFADQFIRDEKTSYTGICLFIQLIKSGFRDQANQIAKELAQPGQPEFMHEQSKKLEKLLQGS